MQHYTSSIVIDAPLERVYRLYTTPEHIAGWWPDAERADADAALTQPGARYVVYLKGGGVAHEHILNATVNQLQEREFRQAKGGVTSYGKVTSTFRAVSPAATEVSLNVDWSLEPKWIAPVLIPLIRGLAEKLMYTELVNLKAYAERHS